MTKLFHSFLKKSFSRYRLLVFAVLFIAVVRGPAMAQNGSTPLALTPGVPAGSYAMSNIDTVNLFNGRVNVHIPLGDILGRGGAKGYASMTWDSPAGWHVVTYYGPEGAGPYYYAEADAAGADAFTTNGLHLGETYIHSKSAGEGANFCDVGAFGYNFYIHSRTTTRFWFVDESGTEHEMRDVASGGQPLDFTGNCWSVHGPSRGTKFVSTDGSGATYIADAEIYDGFIIDNEYPSGGGGGGWLLLKDGRRIRSGTGNVPPLRDRNGNTLYFGGPIKDSLNRQYMIPAQPSASECLALGPGASEYCQKFTNKGFGGAERPLWIAYDLSYRPLYIILSSNLKYHFYYNDYGDITQIDLPAGGSIEYTYEPGLTGIQPDYSYIDGAIPGTYSTAIYRRLTERRVYREGHILESRQTISKPESIDSIDQYGGLHHSNLGYVERKQFDSGNTLLGSERHYFYGSAFFSGVGGMSYAAWRDGREYHTETYDQNGNLLRQVDQTWEQRAPISWWTGSPDGAPQNDPRITEVVSRLENGLTSKVSYTYDPTVPYNSVTDTYEYDFGSGTPGPLLRHTQTSYLKTLNGVDYSASNIQYATDPHMRDFRLQVSVFDGGGVERSRTTYEYDNYNTDSNHAGLVARANISGLDPSYTTSFTIRGNVTGTTNYLLDNGTVVGSISSYAQYDVAGNVVKTIDPRGFVTTLDYTDCFGAPDNDARVNTAPSELSTPGQSSYAFVTSATKAGQTVYAQFDYYLGQAVNVEDANGVVSSAYFNDVLDRPTQVIRAVNQGAPIKSQSAFSYDDVNRIVTSTSDLSSYNDNSLKSQSVYDGLGRTIETRTYENATQYIAVKATPFVVLQDPDTSAWVQATQSSNPFRPYLAEQPIWSTSFMDSLGRVVKVRTPDSAILRTYYDGARTLVVDQIGKERLSLTNALGDLRDVWEITSADGETEGVSFPGRAEVTAGYHTNYEYDALSHLTKVTQGTQPQRVFAYDTLGRLSSASNPENGTMSYQYDQSGDVIVKTDARGVSAHYSYDELNRPVRRWYNGSTSTGATTQNSPALPSSVGASDEANYFYDSQTLPAGAPTFTRGSSTGRLVATTYGTGSNAGDYYGYDAGGRAVLKIQQTGGINYQVIAGYNVSGRVTSGVYPSGHAVSYNYDGAGRPLSFVGNLGDGTQRSYSTETIYSPLGGMTQEKFGTDTALYNKLFYNSRGQLSEIREGETPNDTSWQRGAIINYYSTCWGMCGGSNSTTPMTDNNGNLKKQEIFIPGSNSWLQQYDYDSLNRLQRVHEYTGSQSLDWQQEYVYDRYGNRRIEQDVTKTYGAGVNKKDFAVITASNRLGVPTGQAGTMSYDNAGNLVTDTYSASGVSRAYDAENHMTSETQANNYVAGAYAYDANGQRVRRNIGGVETWQVYGLGGDLLAEYAINAGVPSLQKEYGYRNGQLLITAGTGSTTAPAPSTLAAVPSSGGANVILSWSAAAGATNYRVERKGATGSFTLAGTTASTGLTDTGVSAGGAYLYRVCAANAQGNCTSVFSNMALGAAVSFPTDPTITSSADDPTGVSVTKVKVAHITELRTAVNAVRSLAGLAAGQWTNQTLTATVTVISADDVRDLRTKLDEALTALGIQTSNYDDQTLAGAPNGTIIKKVHITQLRQRATSGTGGAGGSSSTQFGVQWLVVDQLGTPRMVFDDTGSLANVKRHDYLPFGEDLVAGSRATTPGYGAADGVRQKFTGYERDEETGLDFAQARYHSKAQGRFTSPDPFLLSADVGEPQSWDRYSYVVNNPLNNTDPLGLYNVENGANDPFIKELRQDQDKKHEDEPEFDPKDTIIVFIRADKNTGRRISEGEAAARTIRNMMGSSLADEFDQGAAQPSGPYFQASTADDSPGTLRMAWEFFSGRGPRHRDFGPNASMTRNMMTSPDVAAHRQQFIQQGGGTYGPTGRTFGVKAQDGPVTAGTNGPRQFVGSFTITITECLNGDAWFELTNSTNLPSLLYHIPGVQPIQRSEMLPLSDKTQTFWWIERGLIKR
jgi:RHS repeat-associated protein